MKSPMYSVLIVDDEKPVIESIVYMLQKYRPELRVAGTASSGREAIQKAETTKPDIILIDVKMPGIDGLEALREIKRKMPYIMPILTTAYERFDIAQTAFELGVQDYILKPFSREKLISAVDAAVRTLDRSSSGQGESLKHIEMLNSLQGSIEQLFFKAIRFGSSLNEFVPYVQMTLSLHTSRGCIGLLEWEKGMNNAGGGPDEGDQEQRIRTGQQILTRIKYKFTCLGSVSPEGIIFFFPEGGDGKKVPSSQQVEAHLQREQGMTPRWNYSTGEIVEFSRLFTSFQQAKQRNAAEGADDPEYIVVLSKRDDWRLAFSGMILSGDQAGVLRLLENEILSIEDMSLARAAVLYIGLYIEHKRTISTEYSLLICQAENREELHERSVRWFNQLIETASSLQEANIPGPLKRSLEYIELHYALPVQLSDLAEHVEVSPAYLSNLFTRHLGKTFVDYLTDCRIEKAKNLLAEKSHSIKTISHLVGYQDPNYFSRLFKKQTGQSPSDFRP